MAFARRSLRYLLRDSFLARKSTRPSRSSSNNSVNRPSNRPLASAVVTVRLVTDSADQVINNHFIDRGGHVAFGKGPNALMVASSHHSFGNTMAANEVRYHAAFQMAADDKLS